MTEHEHSVASNVVVHLRVADPDRALTPRLILPLPKRLGPAPLSRFVPDLPLGGLHQRPAPPLLSHSRDLMRFAAAAHRLRTIGR
jgi:hypothetical protein